MNATLEPREVDKPIAQRWLRATLALFLFAHHPLINVVRQSFREGSPISLCVEEHNNREIPVEIEHSGAAESGRVATMPIGFLAVVPSQRNPRFRVAICT
jgi:hypothetical protein